MLIVGCDGKDGVLTAAVQEPGSTGDATTTAVTTGDSPTTGDSTTTGDVAPLVPEPCAPNNAQCPAEAVCCSDDPATVGGKLPNYFTGTVDASYDVPIFSNDNNGLGTSGQCIEVGGFATPMNNGCPVPCNPTWDPARIDEICGIGEIVTCCQTAAVDPDRDCIIDPQTERWRTVTGVDILAGLTSWGDLHATNQDPYGQGCGIFTAGGNGMIDPSEQPALEDCYAQLTVADQRGFCFAGECPCQEDPCDMKNPDWTPRCAG
ncbi:MAG TPA: hypothetical protein VGB85_16570 [Nannocystis sp.]